MKLAEGTPGQNAAVQTCSELRVAEVIILFYFILASDQRYDLIVLTFNSHRLAQSPSLCIRCPLSIQLTEETFLSYVGVSL